MRYCNQTWCISSLLLWTDFIVKFTKLYKMKLNDLWFQSLRLQLMLFRTYLFTCKQSVAEDLRKLVWPRDYLYENSEIYSLAVSILLLFFICCIGFKPTNSVVWFKLCKLSKLIACFVDYKESLTTSIDLKKNEPKLYSQEYKE
jgi:hypothetical protein